MSTGNVSSVKPIFLSPVHENLPAELVPLKQWVAWRAEYRPDQSKPWTKVPMATNKPHTRASSTRNYGWGTALGAKIECERRTLDGVGFVLTLADPYVAIDLDKCVTGDAVEPWASEIVTRFASYTEISPSGTGIRIIGRGTLPGGKGRKCGPVEAYTTGRFVTMTGRRDRQPRHH